ncbi:MAG: hypothetical protein ABFC96_16030 [Thermoguttaceae bacterium]
MQVCRTEATVSGDGTVIVKDVPLPPGATVEVVVRTLPVSGREAASYPLRGTPIRYVDPYESVAEGEWESLR